MDSLTKALSFSQYENLKLKTEIAKVSQDTCILVYLYMCHMILCSLTLPPLQAQLSGLAPLAVPKRLVHRGWRRADKGEGKGEGVGEGEGHELNQTDQEKSIVKDTANILEVRRFVCMHIYLRVIVRATQVHFA